jgi:hypothetical protein
MKKPDLDAPLAPDIKHLWLADVEDHDYEAALRFLTIRVGQRRAKALVKALRKSSLTDLRANDILRACDLKPLEVTDPGTHHDMVKTIVGKPLSPVLVVSFTDGTSTIADGYHRVSWAYCISPWAAVPARLASEHG